SSPALRKLVHAPQRESVERDVSGRFADAERVLWSCARAVWRREAPRPSQEEGAGLDPVERAVFGHKSEGVVCLAQAAQHAGLEAIREDGALSPEGAVEPAGDEHAQALHGSRE